jgi:hypothetical protein
MTHGRGRVYAAHGTGPIYRAHVPNKEQQYNNEDTINLLTKQTSFLHIAMERKRNGVVVRLCERKLDRFM